MSAALTLAAGCGFPHDRYASDPLLGSFNRPIAPTPPIWTGGDPGFSPAHDAGAHIGLPSPDVPARSNPGLERMFIVPTYQGTLGMGRLFNGGTKASTDSGGIQRVTSPTTPSAPIAPQRRAGAALFSAQELPDAPATYLPSSADPHASTVTARQIDLHTLVTSGSSIVPSGPMAVPVSPIAAIKDPREIATVQEGQSILQTCGAKQQVMEQQPTGEWRFICTIGSGDELRRYEAKSGDQLEAVRAVMIQLKKEQ
jgi:hypothetical protein